MRFIDTSFNIQSKKNKSRKEESFSSSFKNYELSSGIDAKSRVGKDLITSYNKLIYEIENNSTDKATYIRTFKKYLNDYKALKKNGNGKWTKKMWNYDDIIVDDWYKGYEAKKSKCSNSWKKLYGEEIYDSYEYDEYDYE